MIKKPIFNNFSEYWYYARALSENQRKIIFRSLPSEQKASLDSSYRKDGWNDVFWRNEVNERLDELKEAFEAWEKKHGSGSVVAFESFSTKDTDFSSQLTKIIRSKAEVLFTPQYYNEVALIVKQAKELGWNNIESRNISGENIHDISNEMFDVVCGKLQDADVKINCFGSAIAN